MEGKRRVKTKLPKEKTVPRKQDSIQRKETRARIEELVSKLFEKPGNK